MKKGFTRLVKALRSNQSSAKLTQSPSRFSLGFAPCSESFAVEPSVQACSISSLSEIHFRSFRSQIRSLTGLRFARPSAFTLAEVLITLSVLGVVAAITVPGIIRHYQDRSAVTKVLKVYSVFDTAISQMNIAEGYPETWSWPSTGSEARAGYYSQQLQKYIAHTGKTSGVIAGTYYNLTKTGSVVPGTSACRSGAFQLKDGTGIMFCTYDPASYVRGQMIVDLNGPKGPNRFGYDAFRFILGKEGIITGQAFATETDCSHTNTFGWIGATCYRWIIRHKNMDYKYKDVSSQLASELYAIGYKY